MTAQRRIFGFCALLFAAGFACLVMALCMPAFNTDEATATNAFINWCDQTSHVDQAAGKRYEALFTSRDYMNDLGIGLMLTAASSASIIAMLNNSRETHVHSWLRTPSSPGKWNSRDLMAVCGIRIQLWPGF